MSQDGLAAILWRTHQFVCTAEWQKSLGHTDQKDNNTIADAFADFATGQSICCDIVLLSRQQNKIHLANYKVALKARPQSTHSTTLTEEAAQYLAEWQRILH